MATSSLGGLRLLAIAGAVSASFAVAGACTVFNGISASTCTTWSSGYLSLDQAAHACAYLLTCDNSGQFMVDIESSIGVVTSATSYAYCMNALAGTIPSTRPGTNVDSAALLCVANASSCAAARACMGIESIDDPTTDPRCAHAPDSGVYCSDGGGSIVDCVDSFIENCAEPPFTAGTCVIPPGDPFDYFCGDDGGGYPGCTACDISSSLMTTCLPDASLEGYVLCASLGQTCGTVVFPPDGGDASDAGAPDATPECFTNGAYAPCDIDFSDECVDGAIETCNFFTTLSPTDCNAIGDKCVQGNQPFCTPPNAACTPFTPGIGGCQGDVLSLCIDGKTMPYDCRCAGMTCKTLDGGPQNGACLAP